MALHNLPGVKLPTLLLALLSTLSFNSDANRSAAECIRISDDKKRLACYDSYFSRLINDSLVEQIQTDTNHSNSKHAASDSTPSEANTRLMDSQPTPKATAETIAATAPVAPLPPVNSLPAPTDAPTANVKKPTQNKPTDNTDSLFGFEEKVASITPDEINSIAIGQFKEWKKKMNVTLENGQVWRITDFRKIYYRSENPSVIITKGALGVFYMKVDSLNSRIKVKRIK